MKRDFSLTFVTFRLVCFSLLKGNELELLDSVHAGQRLGAALDS